MLRIWVYFQQKGAMKMKKNSALAGFCERFHSILEALDEYELDESLEELNAQFEDAIFLLESTDMDDEDAQEEIEGALEEIEDILNEYLELAQERPEISGKISELEMAVQMAQNNLI